MTREGAAAIVTLGREHARNALDQRHWDGLAELAGEIHADPDVRVAVLRSDTPGVFASGGDLKELRRLASTSGGAQGAYLRSVERALGGIRGSSQPWIAIVDGDCIGGALELACACDVRLVSTRSRFGLPAATLDVLVQPRELAALALLLGAATVRQLLLWGKPCPADSDLGRRVATEVVDASELPDRQHAWVQRMSGLAPSAVLVLRRGLADLLEALVASTGPAAPSRFAGPEFLSRLDALEGVR